MNTNDNSESVISTIGGRLLEQDSITCGTLSVLHVGPCQCYMWDLVSVTCGTLSVLHVGHCQCYMSDIVSTMATSRG